MMRRFVVLLHTLLLFVLFGCSSSSSIKLSSGTISADEVQEVVRTNQEKMHSLRAEGRISVENPNLAQSGSFALMLRKPDSLLINIRGPFGFRVGSALVTRTSFMFYNSLRNQLISGSTSSENLSKILSLNIGFDDMLNLFTGGVFLQDDRHTPDEIRIEEEQYVLLYKGSEGSRQYWVDPASLLINKIQYLNPKGMLSFEQTFSNFQTVDGVTLPFRIKVLRPKERQLMALAFSDVLVNTDPVPFSFSYPSNAERIRW